MSHPQGVSSGGAPPRLAVSCPTCASFPGYSWRRVKAPRGRARPDLQLENGRGALCWGVVRGGPRALCPGRAISGRPVPVEGGPGLSAFLPLDSPVTPPLGTVSACSDPWWPSSRLTAPHRPGGHRALAEGRGSGRTARSVGRWLSMGAPVKATWPPATLPGLTWMSVEAGPRWVSQFVLPHRHSTPTWCPPPPPAHSPSPRVCAPAGGAQPNWVCRGHTRMQRQETLGGPTPQAEGPAARLAPRERAGHQLPPPEEPTAKPRRGLAAGHPGPGSRDRSGPNGPRKSCT